MHRDLLHTGLQAFFGEGRQGHGGGARQVLEEVPPIHVGTPVVCRWSAQVSFAQEGMSVKDALFRRGRSWLVSVRRAGARESSAKSSPF